MNWKINTILSCLMILIFLPGYTQSYSIIEAEEVVSLMEDSTIAIIDVSKEADYNTEHLPGAINVSRSHFTDQEADFGGVIAPKAQMEELLSQLGITPTTRLILYDNKGLCEAARLWWILNRYGHKNMQLMNGGLAYWKLNNYPLSSEIPPITKTNYQFEGEINNAHYASLEDVQNAIDNPNIALLDARTLDEYTGQFQKNGAFKAGRIPNSEWCDWGNNVDYDSTQKFKSINELNALYSNLGITPDQEVIVYCQSGVRSAHTTFVLTELLGFKNVKNYDGSWIEWSYHDDLSIDSGFVAKTITDNNNLTSIGESMKQISVDYWNLFTESFGSFANYTWNEITFNVPNWYVNYFWMLVALSLIVWALEAMFPWRKNQPLVRKDFWLDAFYMFFNFYIFKIIIFMAFSNVTEQAFKDLFGGDLSKLALINLKDFPEWVQLLIFFVATDFIQWFTHVILHRYEFFWRFHKVHHSVEQMGFAAHLRYHWMENVFYTPMKYIMVMLIGGFTPDQAFIVFYTAITIGHLNHANIKLNYGPLKYIFNSPEMHIWHHAYTLPENHKHGVNFGISLSIWDYIFRTNYIPESGRDIRLGFEDIEEFPQGFFGQLIYGFGPDKKKKK